MIVVPALLSVGLAFAALAQASDMSADTKELYPPYRNCLFDKSLKLEVSDAPIDQIVAAAVTACHATRAKLQASMDVDFVQADQAAGRQSSSDRSDRALIELDRRLSQEIKLALLQKRAARKSK